MIGVINPIRVRGLESTDQITMSGDGQAYIIVDGDLDYATIIGTGKPTAVTLGIFRGYSLPLYAANEELFFCFPVPPQYSGEADIICVVCGYISLAEDTKKFQLRIAWEHVTAGVDVFPVTSNDVDVETDTGATAPQFQSYHIEFTGLTATDVTAFNANLMILISVYIRIIGVGNISGGLAGLLITLIPYRKGKKWAWFAVLITGMVSIVPTLIITNVVLGSHYLYMVFIISMIIWIISLVPL